MATIRERIARLVYRLRAGLVLALGGVMPEKTPLAMDKEKSGLERQIENARAWERGLRKLAQMAREREEKREKSFIRRLIRRLAH